MRTAFQTVIYTISSKSKNNHFNTFEEQAANRLTLSIFIFPHFQTKIYRDVLKWLSSQGVFFCIHVTFDVGVFSILVKEKVYIKDKRR